MLLIDDDRDVEEESLDWTMWKEPRLTFGTGKSSSSVRMPSIQMHWLFWKHQAKGDVLINIS